MSNGHANWNQYSRETLNENIVDYMAEIYCLEQILVERRTNHPELLFLSHRHTYERVVGVVYECYVEDLLLWEVLAILK